MRDELTYRPPDFTAAALVAAPNARLQEAATSGIPPAAFYSTTNHPTYIKHQGQWSLVNRQRMDAAVVWNMAARAFECTEMRRVLAGQPVVVGKDEDGSSGIFVHTDGFDAPSDSVADPFAFMRNVISREHPVPYTDIAEVVMAHRNLSGYTIWVLGPAVVHSGARDAMSWFIERGYVSVIFGGNAVAAHDIECAMFGTTLGMNRKGVPVHGGHRHHMDAINAVRAAGSIANAVNAQRPIIRDGIMYSAVKTGVPRVLAGSIRDDGPLPDVITDTLAAQDAMRSHTQQATLVVMLATMLHSIATGNMMLVFTVRGGTLHPVYTTAVDQSEHVLTKLIDRGTHQAIGIVRNADDFLVRLKLEIERLEVAHGLNQPTRPA